MSASGQRLGLRLFLEGIEVPVVAASIQIGINSPATASVQIVPGDKITEFKARTMLHLFFWDYTRDFEPILDPQSPESVAEYLQVDIEEARRIIAENPRQLTEEFDELRGYKLLYAGEIIGFTFVKTPAGRQCVLQCSDFSTYWDTTYQFMVSYGPNGNFMGTSASNWAGSDSIFDDISGGHVAAIEEALASKPQTPGLENVKGLMGSIIALLEKMGGIPKHTSGVNDFFTIAELKNHILQQICCEQNDDTAKRLFNDKAFAQWLNNGLSSLGTMCTFRDMLRLLFQFVYYEVVPNPAALYVPAVKPKTTTKKISVKASTEKIDIPEKVLQEIRAIFTQVDFWIHISQKDIDSQLKEVQTATDYRTRILNLLAVEGVSTRTLRALGNAGGVLNHIKASVRVVARGLRELTPTPRTPDINRDPAIQSTTVIRDVQTVSDTNIAAFDDNRRTWTQFRNLLAEAANQTVDKKASTRILTKTFGAELDRLHSQVFRPDCFFVAPPRCNVLFPDQYSQFQFSRNFLQEVTRLRLHIGWEFGLNEGLLETEYYYAPITKDIQEIAKKQGNSGYRALLPWEIYSGILPKFETMHEVNYKAGSAERKRKLVTKDTRGVSRNYGQRVANFNYMKYRFAARSAEVSAKFNPFMVCGFPCAIIDRPFVINPDSPSDQGRLAVALGKVNQDREQKISIDDMSDHIRDVAREFGAPSQYIGMVAGLSHNVDQSGGGTSFTMTHARTHRITEDDFLNIFSQELTRQVETEIVATTLDAEQLLNKRDFRGLKFLIDATDQKMGVRLEEVLKRQAEVQTSTDPEDINESDIELEDRPDGTPDIGEVEGISSFGSLLNMPRPEPDSAIATGADKAAASTTEGEVTLIGKIREVRLVNGSKIVFTPLFAGELQAGKKKGPKGGKVVQVQAHTDAAYLVTGINFGKTVTTKNPQLISQGPLELFTGTKTRTKPSKSEKRFFVWKRITIYEEKPSGKKLSKLIPVEEAMRPAWFSPLYSNWFIGDEIYQPFFGTGSVVDFALFQAVDSNQRVGASFGTGRMQQEAMLDKLRDAGGDFMAITKILEEAKAKNISDVPDVESALDALAYIYGEVRRLGLDVHKFVHDYTRRPIATMENIFGSYDLEYELQSNNTLKIKNGSPGFHSAAIDKLAGTHGQLVGLLDNPDQPLARIRKTGKKEPLSRKLDPRPGRRKKVEEYLIEIGAATGSLGVGVEG